MCYLASRTEGWIVNSYNIFRKYVVRHSDGRREQESQPSVGLAHPALASLPLFAR